MSNDQFYCLIESWPADEWPLPLTEETLEHLNEVAPPGCHYAREHKMGEHDRIELYGYAGDMNR